MHFITKTITEEWILRFSKSVFCFQADVTFQIVAKMVLFSSQAHKFLLRTQRFVIYEQSVLSRAQRESRDVSTDGSFQTFVWATLGFYNRDNLGNGCRNSSVTAQMLQWSTLTAVIVSLVRLAWLHEDRHWVTAGMFVCSCWKHQTGWCRHRVSNFHFNFTVIILN